MEGNLPQCSLNLHASIMLGSRRVEAKWIICLFRLFECLGTCVIWGCNDGSHQSRLAIRQHTSSVSFGKCFQAACPLEYLGFWILINSRAPYFLEYLGFWSFLAHTAPLPSLHLPRSLLFAFLLYRCVCHRSLLFAFLVTGFKHAFNGFLPHLRGLIPYSNKFFATHHSFCNACCSSLDRVGS